MRRPRVRDSRCTPPLRASRSSPSNRAPSTPLPSLHLFDLGTEEARAQLAKRCGIATRQELHIAGDVARTAPSRFADLLAHLERGLVGARYQHDLGTHDVTDRAREQRVVR